MSYYALQWFKRLSLTTTDLKARHAVCGRCDSAVLNRNPVPDWFISRLTIHILNVSRHLTYFCHFPVYLYKYMCRHRCIEKKKFAAKCRNLVFTWYLGRNEKYKSFYLSGPIFNKHMQVFSSNPSKATQILRRITSIIK